MDVIIHTTNGKKHQFAIEPGEGERQALENLVPARIFTQQVLQMRGPASLYSFNPALIEWVEFLNLPRDLPASWTASPALNVLKSISLEVFHKKLKDLKPMFRQVRKQKAKGNVLILLGKATFTSGCELCLEAETILEPGMDPRSASVKIFEQSAFCASTESGGILAINPRTMQIWEGHPGVSEPTFFSVEAELRSVE